MMLDEGESIDETIEAMAKWQKYETEEALTIASIGDITEQQKHGITTTLSHGPSFDAAELSALSTNQNIINAVSAISHSRPDNTPEMAAEHLKKKNTASIPAISIHYLYKADKDTLLKMRDLQERFKSIFTFHMAESNLVCKKTVKKHKLRETTLLEKYGLLNEYSLGSHVLHVTNDEIKKLAKNKVGIAHLPTSNAIHKSGTFKFWSFDACNGAKNISLGTDSVVSKSRLDILTEAYQARITHLYDNTIKFGSLFKMMTTNGARALHLKDKGKIIPGMKADLCFWKLKDRGFIPYDENDPITLIGNIITHGGRTVRDLMINGKFIIKDRRHLFVDESKLLEKIQQAHMKIRKKVNKK
jgi:cytosine/adenosine deaminase-related metal-dependent hydrolase